MPVCMECKRDVLADYHEIETKRKTKLIICYECWRKLHRKEVNGARDSK